MAFPLVVPLGEAGTVLWVLSDSSLRVEEDGRLIYEIGPETFERLAEDLAAPSEGPRAHIEHRGRLCLRFSCRDLGDSSGRHVYAEVIVPMSTPLRQSGQMGIGMGRDSYTLLARAVGVRPVRVDS